MSVSCVYPQENEVMIFFYLKAEFHHFTHLKKTVRKKVINFYLHTVLLILGFFFAKLNCKKMPCLILWGLIVHFNYFLLF